ncbi:UPF0496 protein At3g19330-like isoform X2 [Tripterygium wilfordii]|uniref:UPF0496 protein At3g19330-like isoform X2 n=1 Tax=Tripterygium wilfordii TaxID=458696 RepID=UPI0018F86242|nr:UPF0496 protein At3g19330-like isoform X2 [Tripterygium wilfordii]
MLQCISFKSSSGNSSLPTSPPMNNINSHPQLSQGSGNSTDGTPRSSAQPSPVINLTREYTLALQTNSYNEMWTRIHVVDNDQVQEEVEVENGELLLSQVLQPDRDSVEEALRHSRPSTLTRLVSTYFEHSENTTKLCLLLHQSVYQARALYAPIHNLLEVLPHNSHSYTLSEPQCDWASDVFVQFESLDNPFPCPDSHNFHEMRRCFSQLKLQLDRRLSKSRSKVRLLRHTTSGPSLCLIGTAVAAAIAGTVLATHALIAIVAGPCFTAYLPRELTKKESSHIAQLDAAAMCSYILNEDLGTIDCVVARLYTHIEGDKFLIRLGLEKGRERHPIEEVLKQLHKNHLAINEQLNELEERICICFNTVNKTRSRLLQEIRLHQTSYA